MARCGYCGKHHSGGTLFCGYCGNPVDVPDSTPWGNRRSPVVQAGSRGPDQPTRSGKKRHLRFRELGSSRTVDVWVPRNGHLLLGRADPSTGFRPDLDLTTFDAQFLGISRRHAQLHGNSGELYVSDLGSVNGTRVNGKALAPKVSCLLQDGDELQLGRLRLLVLVIDAFSRVG